MAQAFISTSNFELGYRHYNSLFKLAHNELDNLLQNELPQNEPMILEERTKAILMTSKLYLKYIRVSNKFIKCYESIANPQKRQHLRQISDGCIGRALELKHVLVSFELSDFPILDKILLELKMSAQDMDIQIPEYFKERAPHEGRHEKEILADMLQTVQEKEALKNAVTQEEKSVRLATVLIRMIQAHERTRQANELFRDAQKQILKDEYNARKQSWLTKNPQFSRHEAAVIVQKTWRTYKAQKVLKWKLSREKQLLKMVPVKYDNDNATGDTEADRQRIIERIEEEYLDAKNSLKKDFLLHKAPRMIEDLEEKILSYFQEYKDFNGEYPEFPTEEEGGSLTLLSTPTKKEEEVVEEPDPEKETKKGKKDEAKNKGGKKSEEEEPVVYTINPSTYVPKLLELVQYYHSNWAGESLVGTDKFSVELMTLEVEKEVELMVRLQVDEKMREELKRFTTAFQEDSNRKGKKRKKGKQKKKKGKKEPVDLTSDRSTESIIEELVNQRIIIDYPKRSLREFIGEYNNLGPMRQLLKTEVDEPLPCLADIRRAINEYCILPMGSETVHSGGACVKSILLAGPTGSGKTLLVHAICTEVGATMLDLSASNVGDKYPGEDGIEMLMHLILKVSKLLPPAVIYIKDVEDYFWKKKRPKNGVSETGPWKKELAKLIKVLNNTDRIQLIGTTALPFNTDIKGLGRCFSKIICIFKPDYNSRRFLWREFCIQSGGVLTNFNLNALAEVSDGFLASHIKDAVARTLTSRRLAFQSQIPLSALDFFPSLAENIPVYEEEHENYKSWFKTLPLAQQRIAFYETIEEEEIEEEEVSGDDY